MEVAREELASLQAAIDKAGLDVRLSSLPNSRAAVVNGMRLRYLDWGGAREPVVFLHGGGLTAHTWDVVCAGLRDTNHCVAVDLRGHGDSDWSDDLDYSLNAHAADLAGLLEQLGFDRCALVGMSLGGLVALQFAARRPAVLRGLVIVDVGPFISDDGSRRISNFMRESSELDTVEEFVERAMRFNPRRDREALRRSLLHNLRQLPNGRWTWKYDRRPMERQIDRAAFEMSRQNLQQALGQISCSTLVVRGAESEVLTERDARQLVEALPRAHLATVPNAGHSVQGDNPGGLLAHMHPFLKELDR